MIEHELVDGDPATLAGALGLGITYGQSYALCVPVPEASLPAVIERTLDGLFLASP